MKSIRVTLFLAFVLTAGLFLTVRGLDPLTLFAVGAGLFAVSALLAGAPRPRLCVATLSATEILQDTLDAFRVMVPMLDRFSHDLSPATAELNQTIIAHIPTIPTVQQYDATTGYKANAADSEDLLQDVPVTLNRLRHVPVRVKYLSQLASRKNLYVEAIKNQAYALGKDIVDYALSLANGDNFSYSTPIDIDDGDTLTLESVRTELNKQHAAPIGRFGIINTTLAGIIQADSRAGSSDFYGQLNGANGYRRFVNVAGFEEIWEYPDFPHNNESLIGFFGDRRAVTVGARVPDVQSAASFLGIPQIARFETVTDPASGFTLLGILWQEQGTFDVYLTIASLYGIAAGKRTSGASPNASTDRAGHLLTSTTGS